MVFEPIMEMDKAWRALNEDLIEDIKNNNWGFYRNTQYDMAEHLRKDNKLLDSLHHLLLVAYLDLNGPQNLNGPQMFKEHPPFDGNLDNYPIPPTIIKHILSAQKKLELNESELSKIFLSVAKKNKISIMPVSPKFALQKLLDQINTL